MGGKEICNVYKEYRADIPSSGIVYYYLIRFQEKSFRTCDTKRSCQA